MKYNFPNKNGYFGKHGGKYVSEILINILNKLEKKYFFYRYKFNFINKYYKELKNFIGRPTSIYFAKRLTKFLKGAKIFFKREDLNHTGAHKINNVIGQAILAKIMNKKRIIAETGAGQHGLATSTICAKFGIKCTIYMGENDIKRQSENVKKMKLLGSKIISVKTGTKTLKDALNEAMKDWIKNVKNTFYIIGTIAGPHPYPMIVRDFQSIIGYESILQIFENKINIPKYIIASIGGGSNSIGIFYSYIKKNNIKLIGVEAAGKGLHTLLNSSSLNLGKLGVLHGNKTYLLQNKNYQILSTHSISAGLDYPGIGPEHSLLKDLNRIDYEFIINKEALKSFIIFCKIEGIIPALESCHAIAYAMKLAKNLSKNKIILVNLSGRGEKDINNINL
ncbi:putative tryptophan synthase, beta subunit [Candidatus Zinderia insecticola CARI]|uniref:Tryptophan synthase beta chain n=1 Tax=Zinderia insecticola (strain CARI) TaxID=871271 RepID=E0TIT0_ZINIC|nr:putative tryptophan synthase, beta subunit [Candidatus Zinderia insecticola CARI]